MFSTILDHLNVLPSWLRQAVVLSWGSLCFALPLVCLVRAMQTAAMQSFFRAVGRVSKRATALLANQLDDPMKWPLGRRIAQYVTMVQTYILSGLLFVIFICFAVLWGCLASRLSLIQHAAVLSYIFSCVYVGAILKAQAGRDLVKLRTEAR